MNETILCVVGPTASGKTETAILLAERLGGEIISSDARQVYRGMDIGTAKPTADERARARHHLIDVADPDETYHAARFADEAETAMGEIRRRGRLPIVAGGTGLYVRALVRGLDVDVGRHPEVRAEIEGRIEREGLGALHQELARVDPDSAALIHRNDKVRIVRALEVYLVSGKPRSEQHRPAGEARHPFRMAGLFPPREMLYRRIDERFDRMMADRFLDEVRSLLDDGYFPGLPSFRSPGYRELIAHLTGEITLDEAVDRAKRESRRYAKRQITWFLSEDLYAVDIPDEEGTATAADRIARWFERECESD